MARSICPAGTAGTPLPKNCVSAARLKAVLDVKRADINSGVMSPAGRAIAAEDAALVELQQAQADLKKAPRADKAAAKQVVTDKQAALAAAKTNTDTQIADSVSKLAEGWRGVPTVTIKNSVVNANAELKLAGVAGSVVDGRKKASPTVTNTFLVGGVGIGDGSPIVRNKTEFEFGFSNFTLSSEIDIVRSYSPGQGSDPSNLLGPGPKGKILLGGVGLSYLTLGYQPTENFSIKAGHNEIWWQLTAPLQGLFSKSKLPARISYQLGGVVGFDSSPEFDGNTSNFRFVGGLAAGIAEDDINLLNGGLSFVTREDGSFAKSADMSATVLVGGKITNDSKKSHLAINLHGIANFTGAPETATDLMLNVSTRLFLKKFSLGADWRPYNGLALAPGQKDASQWAIASELGFAPIESLKILANANHFSGTTTRSVMENNEGFPGSGTPEDAVVDTSLTDVGLGLVWTPHKSHQVALRIFKGWAPEGEGFAGTLAWRATF